MRPVDGESQISHYKELMLILLYTSACAVPTDATIRGIAVKVLGQVDESAFQTIRDATNTIVSHASDSTANNQIYRLDGENVVTPRI